MTRAARVLVVLVLLAVGGAVGVGCSRIGDDRFPKLPDGPAIDATDFVPDAGGPGGPTDALPGVDAAPDAPITVR